jgi:GT2 family glycosyltransferase
MRRPSTSVVIPTLEGDPETLESVPEGVKTVVVSEGNRAEARNIGARRADGNVLVFCDDDVAFAESFFWEWVEGTDEGSVAGLRDFDFGLLLTRFLVVHRADFERLGAFDERLNHMEDTEFCLAALANGLELVTIPRETVHHEPHESAGQTRWARLRNTAYLGLRYPRYAAKLWLGQLTSREPFIPSGE